VTDLNAIEQISMAFFYIFIKNTLYCMNYQQLCTNMSLDNDLAVEALASGSGLIHI
jgi:hypothetical protein